VGHETASKKRNWLLASTARWYQEQKLDII
jgi:hypothetical protein